MADALLLRESWTAVATYGDQVPLHFYATLFLHHPEVRDLFPVGMAGQRDRLVAALGHIEAQGFLFSRPVPVDAIPALLERFGVCGMNGRRPIQEANSTSTSTNG